MFRNVPGHNEVSKGEYELKDHTAWQFITHGLPASEFFDADVLNLWPNLDIEEAWDTKVIPGSQLVMNIISKGQYDTRKHGALKSALEECPRCGSENEAHLSCGARTW